MPGGQEKEPRSLGYSHVGALWIVFHYGYTAPRLCSSLYLCPGTGNSWTTVSIKDSWTSDMQYMARFQSHLVEQREAVNHVTCFRPSNVGRGSKVKNWEQNTALPFSLIYFIFVLSISYFLSFVKQRKYQSSNSLWFLMLFFFINRLRKKLPSWWWKLFVCVNPVPWWKCGRLDPSLHASSIIGCSLYTTDWPLCTTIPTAIRWEKTEWFFIPNLPLFLTS